MTSRKSDEILQEASELLSSNDNGLSPSDLLQRLEGACYATEEIRIAIYKGMETGAIQLGSGMNFVKP